MGEREANDNADRSPLSGLAAPFCYLPMPPPRHAP